MLEGIIALAILFIFAYLVENFLSIIKKLKKLKTKKYLVLIVILVLISIVFFSIVLNKQGEERIKNRTINAAVYADGKVFVEDIWDINVVNSNTLFQSFGYEKAERFSNIQVSFWDEKTKAWQKMTYNPYISIDGKEKLNCYHAGMFDGQFEIAWGVGLEGSRARRKYKLEYTVVGPVKKYLDTAEYYHQFVGKNFDLPIENFYALISFPVQLKDETSYIWGHGAPSGEIHFKRRTS